VRRPRLRGALERPAAWALRQGSRLRVYGVGITAQSLNITPGGLGVAEGSLSLALVATGLGTSQALAAVLLYRLASFWLVACAGWLVMLWLRRPHGRPGTNP
jgi:putative heme transporter